MKDKVENRIEGKILLLKIGFAFLCVASKAGKWGEVNPPALHELKTVFRGSAVIGTFPMTI